MYKRGYPLSSVWWDAYNSYFENGKESRMAKQVLSSLYYENKTKPLQEKNCQKTYLEKQSMRVSREWRNFSVANFNILLNMV